MKKTKEYLSSEKYQIVLLLIIMAAGGILRLVSCRWGYPYPLHPDESTIVCNTIEMLSRHSYEPNVYNRPDHFEIKCCAILFQIVSYLKYHKAAAETFDENRFVFFMAARGYTAFFGTLLTGLAYMIMDKIKPTAKLIAAALTAFFPVFIFHSSFATPDIVLTFFVLLTAYLSILYLEKPSLKYLALMCISTGIGIAVKYTCAISCIWIAAVVCINCIKNRKYLAVPGYAAFSVLVVFGTTFFIAPNLFTNIGQTIETLQLESRNNHLGADGSGFFGNFLFYINVFLKSAGYESVVFLAAGTAFAFIKKEKNALSLLVGVLFWICTSVLSLHWERWGMPVYIFYILVVSAGISWLYDISKNRIIRSLVIACTCITGLNFILSSSLTVQEKLTADSRAESLSFCQENNITKENSVFEGYTPLSMKDPMFLPLSLDESGELDFPENMTYIITSSDMYDRFYAEPERYKNQVAVYEKIKNDPGLVCIYSSGGPYSSHSDFALTNIFKTVSSLKSHTSGTVTGPVISIYMRDENKLTISESE